jgi:sigma-E factor negative regulatory protein RseC
MASRHRGRKNIATQTPKNTCYNVRMNVPEARVVATGANSATVSVEAQAVCARCAAGRGCGAGLLQQGRTRLLDVRVADGLHLRPGDRVRLELAPLHLLRAAWLAYGLPLFALVVSVALAAVAGEGAGDAGMVAAGAAGLAAGLIAGRRLLRKDSCLRQLTPVASARVGTPGDAPYAGT